jgi:hypothetical protein
MVQTETGGKCREGFTRAECEEMEMKGKHGEYVSVIQGVKVLGTSKGQGVS